MLLKKYLNSFILYNLILLISFCLSVSLINSINYINTIFYIIFHFIIIYLSLYYFRFLLYIIFFIYGLSFDLLLINQIGPHLLIFMFLLISVSQVLKILQKTDSVKMYFLIILIQLTTIFSEMLISNILFNYNINFNLYFNIVLISLILSFPIFLFFKKIDKIK